MKRVIVSADDFGLSEAVNEAVEAAHRDGILTSASLMVAAPAAADAVRRARRLPDLAVGLHLVLVDGPAVLPRAAIPDLLDATGRFGADQARRGFAYSFRPVLYRQLADEIAAQFAAFAATGLALDHANAHKHMHLHPGVARMMIEIGGRFGLRALRVPAEPPAVLAAAGTPLGIGGHALYAWSRVLRRMARRAGLMVNDHAFGIAWSGHMTASRLQRLAPHLPEGLSEIYFHPAAWRDPALVALMPEYEHEAEFQALRDPELAAALPVRTTYSAAARDL
ncbi:hopanoid biosynthesis-associated protein HpnK [Acidibrevibacterium fodinaquatile]|nr:hopanoid biosynthesis-associated protein HpnK [Acidibrevibacterium fodinaquatile]